MKLHRSLSVSLLLSLSLFPQLPAYAAVTQSYTDVPPSHPSYAAVEYLKEFYILGGYPDGTVKPDQLVNRAEACTLILRAARITLPATLDRNDFKDVQAGSWYHPCVQTAKEQNIIRGYPDGTYRPAKTVNSAEALKIFLESQNILFRDNPIQGEWYQKNVLHIQEEGVIDPDFNPATEMTRGALANLLYRFLQKGPLARVHDGYFDVVKGACPVDTALKQELENEIQLLPKENEISTSDRQRAMALYDEAYGLRDENFNDTAASVEKFKQVVVLDPYFPLAWHYIAMYEINQKSNYGMGMRLEQKSRLLVPDDPATTYAVHGIARAYQQLGKPVPAKICFKEAIQFMPGNDYPYLRFAELLREEKRLNEAIVVLEKGLGKEELENDLAGDLAWLMRGIFIDLGDFHGAEFIAKKYLASNHNFYPLILLWGGTYISHAVSPAKAGHYRTVALEVAFLDRNEQGIQGLADSLKEDKTVSGAKLFYEDHYASTQPFLDALQEYWRETALLSKGQALVDINEALKSNPDEPRYLILKARILSENISAFQTEILALLKKAKTLDSFFYDGYFVEGEIYRIQEKYDAARIAYRKVPKYHIDYPRAEQGLYLLIR